MKKIHFILLLMFLLACTITVYAHPGGTDSDGGHYNHSTGEYHYHHGRPAHQHENGVCPYDDNSSGDNSPQASHENDTYVSNDDKELSIAKKLLFFSIAELIFLFIGIVLAKLQSLLTLKFAPRHWFFLYIFLLVLTLLFDWMSYIIIGCLIFIFSIWMQTMLLDILGLWIAFFEKAAEYLKSIFHLTYICIMPLISLAVISFISHP